PVDLLPSSEDAMVLAFLRAERRSTTWAMELALVLSRCGCSASLLENADLANEAENDLRRKVLGEWRGYRRDSYLFGGFPSDDVDWREVRMTVAELAEGKYARDATWDTLSCGTRLISEGAKNVGIVAVPGDTTKTIVAIARRIREGELVQDLISVAEPGARPAGFVLVEGHKRATARAWVADEVQ